MSLIEVHDPGENGVIIPQESMMVGLTIGGGIEYRTLRDPQFISQQILLYQRNPGGKCIIQTECAFDRADHDQLIFDDPGDFVMLIAIEVEDALIWRVLSRNGVEFEKEKGYETTLAPD